MHRRILLTLALFAIAAPAQESAFDFAATIANRYAKSQDVVYSIGDGYENRLDVYQLRDADGPRPTVVYIHGGGWTGGTKESSVFNLLPYMRLGFNAVNVEYRLARNALAPAAVADCRCALRWVFANAERYGFDTTKIVVTGGSAGGHLALTTGMLPKDAGLDFECNNGPHDIEMPVAAIVNWYGITDVNDLLFGKPNEKSYAVRWLGSLPNKEEVARRVSPLTYVRKGLPPILTIHGDADPTVPYTHALRLQKALDEKGVPNQLYTVPGGKHGGFTQEQYKKIYAVVETFLRDHGVL